MTRVAVPIAHCSACGAKVEYRVPEGDTHARAVCPACGHIQYQNPKVVVGSVPVWEDKVLLCRRAIEPRHGKWTLPAGFMERGETTQDGAARETLEEARARVEELGEKRRKLEAHRALLTGDAGAAPPSPGREPTEGPAPVAAPAPLAIAPPASLAVAPPATMR